ncbi:hypothetical protein MKW94_024298 [Papaver nudicaule]|uniref:HTH TFE/IIEalpha-type domain-containing protein n=1 Tax=Papaver nudicaule TaxID=74823 RepID=A0AA42B1S1_PAPNU|nr:hypothetical protein [Papaver nudicaule]
MQTPDQMHKDCAKVSVEPFNRLVKLAARAFYDDNPGMAVVVLDALTRRQWVREEDLARDLKLHPKKLSQILHSLEEEKLVTRDHLHTHSYCCLHYSQVYDVVRYKLHRMKKELKDGPDNWNTVQGYVCTGCKRRCNVLDAFQLISLTGQGLHCKNCNVALVAKSDKLSANEMGDGNDTARRLRRLQEMEEQLKPLLEQLNVVENLPCPEFGALQEWEARTSAAHRAANGNASGNDPSNSSRGYGGAPLPFIPDIELPGAARKILPSWMTMQGMNVLNDLRDELRGEATIDRQDGMKSELEDDDDDFEWVEAPPTGMATETYRLHDFDLNVPAAEEDEIDWEYC